MIFIWCKCDSTCYMILCQLFFLWQMKQRIFWIFGILGLRNSFWFLLFDLQLSWQAAVSSVGPCPWCFWPWPCGCVSLGFLWMNLGVTLKKKKNTTTYQLVNLKQLYHVIVKYTWKTWKSPLRKFIELKRNVIPYPCTCLPKGIV